MTKNHLHSSERSAEKEDTALNKTLALNHPRQQISSPGAAGSQVEGAQVEGAQAGGSNNQSSKCHDPYSEDQVTDQTLDLTAEAVSENDGIDKRQNMKLETAGKTPTGTSSGTSTGAVKSGQQCIMVIDDSKTIRRSAKSLLSKEGWNVVTAEDGFDALAKIVEYKPDIVFVDIMMPRLDGYQTCALIKNNANFNSTPVIMLSSKDSIFDKARGRVVGSEHYLTKPFTRDDLLSTIQKHALSASGRDVPSTSLDNRG